MMKSSRKNFLLTTTGLTLNSIFAFAGNRLSPQITYPISSNVYNWFTFYKREGKDWGNDWDACIKEYTQCGLMAIEPSFSTLNDVKALLPVLDKYKISIPSVYANSVLHKKEEGKNSIETIISIAEVIKNHGTKILVTNPTPIKWGGDEVKTDAELSIQLTNLEDLGAQLKKLGITLAYHTHDTEMMGGAKEFHHMLQNTSKENVSFCFDVHWVFRGSQDSALAVYDVMKMYGDRIVELHLRQSINGVWSETFGPGDIDYTKIAMTLKKLQLKPHLVIEQCIEDRTIVNINVVEAHKRNLISVKKVFDRA
jgi:inosose dehydratase